MNTLIENLQLNETNKLHKPNFESRTGRELLAFYLQTKFKQIINYDKKSEKQIIQNIKEDFIERFIRRLVNKPEQRILISITSNVSISEKPHTIREITAAIEKFNLPVSILNANNYFKDFSKMIDKFGSIQDIADSGYDLFSPTNFNTQQLHDDIKKLQNGLNILSPKSFIQTTGEVLDFSLPIISKKIIIVDGHATGFEGIQENFDIKIFADKKANIKENIYFENAKNDCDISIKDNFDLDYFSKMLEYISVLTNSFK